MIFEGGIRQSLIEWDIGEEFLGILSLISGDELFKLCSARSLFALFLPLFLLLASPALAVTGTLELPGSVGVNQVGASTYSIPIDAPPGTAGMVPSLSLNYNSQGGDGYVGVGWSLGGLSMITRCARTVAQDGFAGAVNNDANDRFCLDGQRLMVISGAYGADNAQYRTERETYSKVISHGATGTGPTWFEVHTKAGLTLQYGNTPDSRALVNEGAPVRAWGLNQATDPKGNYYTVTYYNYQGSWSYNMIYPVTINYTGNINTGVQPYNSIILNYSASANYSSTNGSAIRQYHDGGIRVEGALELSSIYADTVYAGQPSSIRYMLNYQQSPVTSREEVTSVTKCDGNGVCLLPTTFGWPSASGAGTITATGGTQTNPCQGASIVGSGDFNGDGKTDFVCYLSQTVLVAFAKGDGTFQSSSQWQNLNCTIALEVQVGDFNGDGKTDLICNNANYTHTVWLSNGDGTFTAKSPTVTWCDPGHVAEGDFNGDGRTDLICNGINDQHNVALSNGDGTFTFPTNTVTWCDPTHLAMGDLNGDGKTDLICNADSSYGAQNGEHIIAFSNGDGTFTQAAATWWPSSGTWCTPANVAYGDFDGDGKTDLICNASNGTQTVAFSNGDGTFDSFPSWPSSGSGWCASPSAVQYGDFNGDGRTDMACINSSGNITLAFSDGFGNFVPQATQSGWCTSSYLSVGDFNGDGRSDVICLPSNGSMTVGFTNGAPDLMSSVTSGVGASTSVTYSPISAGAITGPMYVTTSIATSNGVGGTYSLNYGYTGPEMDFTGRSFLGFQLMSTGDPQTNILTKTTYNQTWPYTGTVASETVAHLGTTISQITNYYATLTPGGVPAGLNQLVYVSSSTTSQWELNGGALPTITTSYQSGSYPLDAYNGNPTQVVASTSDGYSSTATSTYSDNTSTWIIGRLTSSVVTNTGPGSAGVTRTTSYAYDSAGALIQQQVEPSSTTLDITSNFSLDSYGNILTATVSGGNVTSRTTTQTYDSYGRFPLSTSNALNQTTVVAYDPRFGGITSQTDPNGAIASWTYDTLGRETQETRPDGTQTDWAYYSGVGCAGTCYILQTATGAPYSYTVYDTLLRPYYSMTLSFDGASLIMTGLTGYDSLGRAATIYAPHFSGATTLYYSSYSYDDLGRVLQQIRPDGSALNYSYSTSGSMGVSSVTLSGAGIASQTAKKFANSQGETVQFIDANGGSTAYVYDPFGNLASVTDPLGNVVTMTYDQRGNQTGLHDPDKGVWSFGYDALGSMISRTDAAGGTVSVAYDLLERPVSTTGAVTPTSAWTYDTQPHGVGKLSTASTNTGYSRAESYDVYGRPSQTTITVDGTAYTTATGYDGSGRVSSIAYPSGQVAGYIYNTQGYLSSVTNGAGGSAFWTANQRDAYLNLTSESYGNGVVTTQGFDPAMGRVTSIAVGSSGSMRNLAYSWNLAGDLSSRLDYTYGVTETFGYDLLNRLTSSTIGSVGKTIAYDAVGDITSKSDVGTYSYPASGAGSVRPHAVSSIAGTVNSGSALVANPSYGYDANGRMVSGGGRSFTYAGFDAPQTIANSATSVSFTFDDGLQRSKQVAPEGTTVYIAAGGVLTEKFTAAASGAVTWRSYIMAAGQRIGVANQTGGSGTSWGAGNWGSFSWGGAIVSLAYFHQDHLGSIVALTNAAGAVMEQDAYDPWGKRRNLNGADDPYDTIGSQTVRGYTDQEHLADSALIHMNGRVYDPQIGKFTGTDPLGVGYAYVQNNPLNSIDPSGMAGESITYGGLSYDQVQLGFHPTWAQRFVPSAAPQLASVSTNVGPLAVPTQDFTTSAPQVADSSGDNSATPGPMVDNSPGGSDSQSGPDGGAPGRSGSPNAPAAGSDFDIGGGVSNYCLSPIDCSAGATSADSYNAMVNNQIAAAYSVQWVAQMTVPVLAAHPAAMPGATRQMPAWGIQNSPAAAFIVGNINITMGEIAPIQKCFFIVCSPHQKLIYTGLTALNLLGGGGEAAETVVPVARGGVYALRNLEGVIMRTGRTGDLARRAAEHARDPLLRDFAFDPLYKTDVYEEQRGLEQLLHDAHSPPFNKINPINPLNPRYDEYMNAGRNYLNRIGQ